MTVWKLHMIIQKWEESLGRIYIPIKVKGLSMRVYCTEIVYLASHRFFQGISRNGSMSKYKSLLKKRTMWTHTSHTFLLNVVLKNNQKNSQTNKQTNFENFEGSFRLKSHCIKIRGAFRTMTNINDAEDKNRSLFW